MRRTTTRTVPGWPPKELELPDTLQAIEAGRHGPHVQGALFAPTADDTRQSRLRRLLAVPGVTLATKVLRPRA